MPICFSHHSHFGLCKIKIWLYPQQVKPLVVSCYFYDKERTFNERHKNVIPWLPPDLYFLSFFHITLTWLSCSSHDFLLLRYTCSCLLHASLGLECPTQHLFSRIIPQNFVRSHHFHMRKILHLLAKSLLFFETYLLLDTRYSTFRAIIWLLNFSFVILSLSWKQRLFLQTVSPTPAAAWST